MKQTNTPNDLFFDQLHDLHSMESQLGASLPKLSVQAKNPQLQDLIRHHAAQTNSQLNRIVEIFQRHGIPVKTDKCKAIAGLIEGGDKHLAAVDNPDTRDLMMIAHCLRIESYEMAAYTITGLLADQLGYKEESATLAVILNEERQTLEALLEVQPEIFEEASQSRREKVPS